MGERKTDDAVIQRIVRFVLHNTPSNEAYLRIESKTWTSDDFLYAIERVGSDLNDKPKGTVEQVLPLYRELRKERQETEARLALETENTKRHAEISRQLEQLKQPHWSVVPNFWMTLVILILTLVGMIVAIVGLRH